MQRGLESLPADVAAATSITTAGITWVHDMNEVLQLFATVVAIVAGATAAWWHVEKALHARRERKNERKGRLE